ncbi:ATP-binding cassette domain-containing protein [Erythrobacter sp. BLCC-B19]|uniref:ATP-binding cassette domain-containing protein n=1 Tax=Erythrobacter sp. BLCC-B19 TaxID=3025315 RepID=UPI002360B9BC|nr:ABC transporter ATP-binding protein [Erythrobacter sp. BLCC-B19]WDA41281.1 ABC transporter ATP-binding protein [Erythrobacter sp. BLCC-B19]
MTAALAMTAVHVKRGGQPIVQDVSAVISPASWFGVIGANGSGKTTLLRAIAGRLPISQGSCRVLGEECAQDRGARAQAIGFAPPIEHFPASLRLSQLIELAGDPVDTQRQRNEDLWNALGLTALLDIPAGECSSGMRQRAAIALAFARPCPIVILDEPFNWLDPVAAFDIRAVLARLVADGLTLITALHDLTTLCGFCDSGIVMAKGQVSLTLDTDTLRAGRNDSARFESNLVQALR